MTGIDTPQIVYDGEYECSTGQSITFDYCCCAARFTNANARVLLEVQRPDGTIKVLDAAGIIFLRQIWMATAQMNHTIMFPTVRGHVHTSSIWGEGMYFSVNL